MCKYSGRRYLSRLSGYMRDFIVETWERHRLWGIMYYCLPTSILPLHSARSSAYVTESASLPIAVYLVLDLFSYLPIYYKVLIKWYFFRAKQPLVIVV